jgi:glycosyltransferase involved in cell wall biosynthesis
MWSSNWRATHHAKIGRSVRLIPLQFAATNRRLPENMSNSRKASIIDSRPRALYILTTSQSLTLTRGQFAFLTHAGFDVSVIASAGEELCAAHEIEQVDVVTIPIAREISLGGDVVSLWRLCCAIRRLRPAITNVSTPKAGLLGGISAWLNRVPCRFYTLRGLRCEATTGVKRRLLIFSERIACLCAHRVICVSESLRQKAIALRVVDVRRTLVLSSGSSNGVDAARFVNSPELSQRAATIRKQLNISGAVPVVGFVGRLTRDKGVIELLRAFSILKKEFPAVKLLLVGDFEIGDPPPDGVRRTIAEDPQIIHTGFVPDAAAHYQLMNVLALPTYREGFPNVVLEAHAAGIPVVATRVTGVVDAVNDEVDGLLVPLNDAVALASALAQVLRDTKLAKRLGRAGRQRVLCDFKPVTMWNAIVTAYGDLLHEHGIVLSVRDANETAPYLSAHAKPSEH